MNSNTTNMLKKHKNSKAILHGLDIVYNKEQESMSVGYVNRLVWSHQNGMDRRGLSCGEILFD